ncbi:MAG: adenylate/guanylate cyclase domain-containing protein [Chthoniobacteraceae bacterium]
MLKACILRYFKATLIFGFSAVVLALALYEFGAFAKLDAALAAFLGRPSPPVVERGLQYFLALLFSFGMAWTTIDIARPSFKAAVALAALAETVSSVWVLNLFDVYFSPFVSIVAIVASFAGSFIYAQSPAGSRKTALMALLGDRVSAGTFASLMESDMPLVFEGEVREATVLVCEVFNHEELLATLRTDNYVAMMNSFLQNAADFLVEQGAYLDECDGESLRVLFGAPLRDPRHGSNACDAALELCTRLEAVNRECVATWGKMFDYRIGINSGDVILAAYGSRRLGALSVSGEPVEFARRLCSANSIYGTRMLIGAKTFSLAEDSIEVRPMELIQRMPHDPAREEVYELIARKDHLSEPQRARRDLYWKGVVYYREQLLDQALATFHEAREKFGTDGAVDFYIRRIEQIQRGLPSLDWGTSRL